MSTLYLPNAHRLSGETQQGILVRMGGSLCIVYDSTENIWWVSPQVVTVPGGIVAFIWRDPAGNIS